LDWGFVVSVYKRFKFSENTPFSLASRLNTIYLMPMQILFCTSLDGLFFTISNPKPSFKKCVLDISALHGRFCSNDLFFLYINWINNTIVQSQSFKNHLSYSNANSILYNFGGSSLHNIKSPKP
jgi:hypothetical protein